MHYHTRNDGKIVCWIDEVKNPITNRWSSREFLEERDWPESKGGFERGKDYNHSTYCDLLISGLMGIRPQSESTLVVHPLIPSHAWDWFCLDGVSYQGHVLTILYDRTGTHYQQGKGFIIFVDGKMKWHSKDIQKVQIDL
jgi:hypothetical protein